MRAEPHAQPTASQPIQWRVGSLGTFSLAFFAALGLALNAAFVESFSSARVAVLTACLLVLHALRFPAVAVTREARLYGLFVAYMLIQLIWTRDMVLALNTIVPAMAFLLMLVLYSSLLEFHDERPVLLGTLAGFALGAALYTAITRFPFAYPAGFSYNAVAQFYLFGLFVNLILAARSRAPYLYLGLACIILVHIMATTSIKTNLGILIGGTAAVIIYRRYFARSARRYAVIIVLLAGSLAYGIASNEALIESVERGMSRVALGIEVLQARENVAGYTGFERRSDWQRQGIAEWTENPLFGYGVEAFRSKYEITSHSTFVDVLYNSGLIGFLLVYGVVASVAWRLYHADETAPDAARAVIFAVGACYLLMTLAGNIHYSAFLAVFIAVSAALLRGRPAKR